MIVRYPYILFVFCLIVLLIGETAACRYNVRETGFVAMDFERFLLVTYIDDQTPDSQVEEIKSLARDLFYDSNIAFELVNVDRQSNHPARDYLKKYAVTSFPAAVLISADGQDLLIASEASDLSFSVKWRKLFGDILSSPMRDKLKQRVIVQYGVVLFIEGRNQRENQQAIKAIEEALVRVKKNMDLMPKPIKNPPVMIRWENKSLAADPILLWVLGLDADKIEKPHAAIFYGKARWLGPLFKDQEITRNNLSEILFVVGADCECGLDKNWLRGTMLPMQWNKKDRETIAANLGFDAENPLIRSEIYHIMRSGSYRADMRESAGGLDSVSGNRKGITDTKDTSNKPAVNPSNTDDQTLEKSIYISAVILGALLLIGLAIVLRRARINNKSTNRFIVLFFSS